MQRKISVGGFVFRRNGFEGERLRVAVNGGLDLAGGAAGTCLRWLLA